MYTVYHDGLVCFFLFNLKKKHTHNRLLEIRVHNNYENMKTKKNERDQLFGPHFSNDNLQSGTTRRTPVTHRSAVLHYRRRTVLVFGDGCTAGR